MDCSFPHLALFLEEETWLEIGWLMVHGSWLRVKGEWLSLVNGSWLRVKG